MTLDSPAPAEPPAALPAGPPAAPPAASQAASPPRRPVREGLLLGLLASGPALLILVLAHTLGGRPGLLEAVADGFGYLPLDVVGAMISTFGPLAKGLLYVGIGVGLVASGALLGVLLDRLLPPGGLAADTLTLAILGVLLAEVVILPLAHGGFFGSDTGYDPLPFHLPLAVAALAYGAVFAGLRSSRDTTRGAAVPTARESSAEEPPALPRRTFLGRGLALVGGLSLAAAGAIMGGQAIAAARRPPPTTAAGLDGFGPTPALTPVPDFYTVAKDIVAPSIDGEAWRLTIDGLVDRPIELGLADLRALPAQAAYRTLECISTEIVRGDHLISNQLWRGVRVGELLDRVGVQAAASWILWGSQDGYTETLPLEVARHPDTWIAYEMGGAPLTADHGFPARVLVAGRFGMKQPKWLTRLSLLDHDEQGYWEQRGWDEQAFVRTMSRLDAPSAGDAVPVGRPFTAYGVAYAGDRGISRVEVSPNDGASWVGAELQDARTAPLGSLTWVRWRAQLTIPRAGSTRLVVRATDGTGALQDGLETPALPSGSTGWHAVRVDALPG